MNGKNLIKFFTVGVTLAFSIGASAQMYVDAIGNVGIGTNSPRVNLHVKGDGGGLVQELLMLESTISPQLIFWNTTTSAKWYFATTSNDDFKISRDGTGVVEARFRPNGDLILHGEIITAGSCSAGCDRVFAPDYELPTIEEHAKAMWSNSFLPTVGVTLEGAPINLSIKTERILNELEKAHIYIEQLHIRNLSLEQRVLELEQQNQRIEGLVMQIVTNQAEQVAIN